MRRWTVLLVIGGLLQSAAGCAQATHSPPGPATRQLRGLGVDEANALIARLEEAQQRLRAGEFQSFELLAGSCASCDMTKRSPRDAFLGLPFAQAWSVERSGADHPLPTYRIAYAPNGLGQLYWDIQVVLGSTGDIERVVMLYKPPAPF